MSDEVDLSSAELDAIANANSQHCTASAWDTNLVTASGKYLAVNCKPGRARAVKYSD